MISQGDKHVDAARPRDCIAVPQFQGGHPMSEFEAIADRVEFGALRGEFPDAIAVYT
jgi:hypothetical protein